MSTRIGVQSPDSHKRSADLEAVETGQHQIQVAGAVLSAAAATAGTGVAIAGGGDDDATDTPITSPDLEKATAAALEHTGGGTVTGTEIEDEERYYEVEVTLDGGGQLDVQLDREFNVVGDEADGANDSDD